MLLSIPLWVLLLMVVCTASTPVLVLMVLWVNRTDPKREESLQKMESLAQHAVESLMTRLPWSIARDGQ